MAEDTVTTNEAKTGEHVEMFRQAFELMANGISTFFRAGGLFASSALNAAADRVAPPSESTPKS